MADEKEFTGAQDAGKKSAKELKKEEKARKKREKKEQKQGLSDMGEEDSENLGSKLVLFLVTLLIIAIWMGIIAVLIKSDVGGFGSSVLYPILKDVPYVNKILPEADNGYMEQESESPYGSLDEALERIKELEQELDTALGKNADDADTIADMQAQIDDLSKYKEEEAAFEKEKEKFQIYIQKKMNLNQKNSNRLLLYHQYMEC